MDLRLIFTMVIMQISKMDLYFTSLILFVLDCLIFSLMFEANFIIIILMIMQIMEVVIMQSIIFLIFIVIKHLIKVFVSKVKDFHLIVCSGVEVKLHYYFYQ